mgnify:CR=1 FL=1
MNAGMNSQTNRPLNGDSVPTDAEPDESVSTAAIYVRTSETKPDHHYSIDEQIRRCWKRCDKHGWEVVFVRESNNLGRVRSLPARRPADERGRRCASESLRQRSGERGCLAGWLGKRS